MTTVKEIQEFKDWAVDVYHSNRLKEQGIDQEYIDDTFVVPFIKASVTPVRTGKGYRMVSAPAEHIVSSNPQLFRDKTKENDTQAQRDANVAKEGNRWLRILLRQNPQPFKQHIKHLLGRGEAWIYLPHNENFKKDNPNNIPVNFVLLDPLIVFADRSEDSGIPTRIIISYQRQASSIQESYPLWAMKNGDTPIKPTEKIPFFMYYDSKTRYFETGGWKDTLGNVFRGEALLRDVKGKLSNGDGLQENIYGFVPFVHAYSGFGMGSVDGDPAYLAVGRIRYCRNRIDEYTAIRSTLNAITYRYAHPSIDLTYTGEEPSGDIREAYNRAPNAFNIIRLPDGATITKAENLLPDAELYTYLASIERDIDREDPLGTIASAIGTSGRQQDIATEASLRRYDSVVENSAHAWATAFGLALKMITKLPALLMPKGLDASDIGDNYECRIELKAEDPVERDRLVTMGERLMINKILDLQTFLTDHYGKTVEQAQQIMTNILVDDATRNNPIIAQIMGENAAREFGMEDQYLALKEATNLTAKELPKGAGSQGGEPRLGNIKTELGQNMADQNLVARGQRRAPVGT